MYRYWFKYNQWTIGAKSTPYGKNKAPCFSVSVSMLVSIDF